MTFENILSRSDGSYVIDRDGWPCHVPNDGEFAELWREVNAYALDHPEEVTEEAPPPPPSLEEIREQTLRRLQAETRARILSGFSHALRGVAYRFGYDEEDQGNFSKANSAALLALMTNDADYRQVWRGWLEGEPQVFQLTAEEYLALSRAGADHQLYWQQRYWEREAAVRAASSLDELDGITL